MAKLSGNRDDLDRQQKPVSRLRYTLNSSLLIAKELEITRLPVRSAIYDQYIGGFIVGWVIAGESPLLYVFLP